MTTYRSRNVLVEAYQWKGSSKDVPMVPLWLRQHALDTHGTDVILSTVRGRESAHFNDYLIRLPDGSVAIMDESVFRQIFTNTTI